MKERQLTFNCISSNRSFVHVEIKPTNQLVTPELQLSFFIACVIPSSSWFLSGDFPIQPMQCGLGDNKGYTTKNTLILPYVSGIYFVWLLFFVHINLKLQITCMYMYHAEFLFPIKGLSQGGGGFVIPSMNFKSGHFHILRNRPCPCQYLTHLCVICPHFLQSYVAVSRSCHLSEYNRASNRASIRKALPNCLKWAIFHVKLSILLNSA